jgi:Rha family phage regulatory protein
MTNLSIINQNGQLYADSREVAEMIDKNHAHLLRDIKGYIEIIDPNPNLDSASFFIPSTYIDSQNQVRPCCLLTRKGCDMVANKMTGEKGILFTATYVTKFEEMEKSLWHPELMKPMTPAEITAMLAQNQVEIERTANKALEIANRADKQITNALDVFTAPPDKDWRQSMNNKMRGMCQQYGLSYLMFYGDLYKELEDVARVDLKARLTRLRARMVANGATKTDCTAVTKLEVVERDPKLRPIFEGIVRKYQAKYAVEHMPEN